MLCILLLLVLACFPLKYLLFLLFFLLLSSPEKPKLNEDFGELASANFLQISFAILGKHALFLISSDTITAIKDAAFNIITFLASTWKFC